MKVRQIAAIASKLARAKRLRAALRVGTLRVTGAVVELPGGRRVSTPDVVQLAQLAAPGIDAAAKALVEQRVASLEAALTAIHGVEAD